MEKLFLRTALRASGQLRIATPLPSTRILQNHTGRRYASTLPSVFQISFWRSLIPKPFRRQPGSSLDSDAQKKKKKERSKEWNPATFYIVIFLFIGSMSIQMIALRKDYDTFMRRADVRIGLLREVVESLQRGEDVDVEKALGTGDAQREKEWVEVLKEIEQDDTVKNKRKAEKTKPPATTATPEKAEPKQEPTGTGPTDQTKIKTTGYSPFF